MTTRRTILALLHLTCALAGVRAFTRPSALRQHRLRTGGRDCAPSKEDNWVDLGGRRRRNTALPALVPVSVEDAATFLNVGGVPNAAQYFSYFGRTQREKYARAMDAFAVSFVGVFFSYFLSFLLGSFLSTVFGFIALFWGFFGPELEAYQRNWELLGGRRLIDPWYGRQNEELPLDQQGLYTALFLGVINDLCVVEFTHSEKEYELDSFIDYRMDEDELEAETGNPYLLRLRMDDTNGRELQVHARMSEEYLDLQVGQSIAGVLLAGSSNFQQLSAMTDFCVPDARRWIGDYPYLDRRAFESYLVETEELWDMMEDERLAFAEEAGIDAQPSRGDQERPPRYDRYGEDEDQGYYRGIEATDATAWKPRSSFEQEERYYDEVQQREGSRADSPSSQRFYDDAEYYD
uniref:Uncharacterized protein n=1 Tax=Grammatophora oceanica TaxID=210454 RepID=A0A7S1VUM8_9STRA